MSQSETHPQPTRPPAAPYLVLGAGLLLALAFFTFHRIEVFDAYMHMAVGKWMLAHGRIPHANLFMYTAQGYPWVDHEWLSQLLFVLVHRALGPAGLQGAACLGYWVAFGLMLWLWRRLGLGAEFAALPFLLALLLPLGRYSPRPELFSNVFLASTIALLLTWRDTAHRAIWALPVLAAGAANCHAGVAAGIGFLWLFTLGEGVQALVRRRWSHPLWPGLPLRRWRTLALVSAASTAALIVNPYGPAWYEAASPSQIRFLSSYIEEWQPLLRPGAEPHIALPILFLFLALLGASFLLSRRVVLSHLAAAAVFAAALFLSQRNSTLLSLAGLGVMAGNLRYAESWLDAVRRRRSVRWTLGVLGALFGLTVLGFAADLPSLRGLGAARPLGLGIQPNVLPVRAERFARLHHLRGRLFNELDYGGYIAFQRPTQRPVFIDGLNAFGPDQVAQYGELMRWGPQAASLIERWGINTALLPHPDPAGRPSPSDIYRFLDESPRWRLVFWDGVSVVYVRDIPAHRALIAQYGYRYLDPGSLYSPAYRQHPAEVAAELRRATAASPDAPYLHVLAGHIYRWMGMLDRAVLEFGEAVRLNPDDPEAYLGLGLALMQGGDAAGAEEMFRRALALHPEPQAARLARGALDRLSAGR